MRREPGDEPSARADPAGEGDGAEGGARARPPERHDLVWIRAEALGAVRVVDRAREEDVLRWLALGRPAVATRAFPGLGAGEIALGIALPRSHGRARLALAAPRAGIRTVEPPLPLAAARGSAPAAWRPSLAALDAEARAAGVLLRVFGSLAWQHLTGGAYVHEESDVDLLVPGADGDERARVLPLLRRWAGHEHPRLDGELRLGAGRAVAWREVLRSPPRVLVKGGAAVTLEPLASALGAGEARP